MTETELAWFAGLFEGEGNIANEGKNAIRISIGMTDRDIIDRVHKLTGVGTVIVMPQRGKPIHKDIYTWRVRRKDDALPLLQSILPFLGERRSKRVREALDRLENCRYKTPCSICFSGSAHKMSCPKNPGQQPKIYL